ncbi:hypothetical protein ACHAXA_008822 [Cyclostephanos tholiformis]|uniref:Uncharacterized protein n=1 Tax=Cyclostephanos tholiformis TaxID=382380 RepID=A0ABD3RBU1_9STRA
MTPRYIISSTSEQSAGLSTAEFSITGDVMGSANQFIDSKIAHSASCASSPATTVVSGGGPKSKMSATAASGVDHLNKLTSFKRGRSKKAYITASEHGPARAASSPAVLGDDMTNSAPTILIQAAPLRAMPIRSIMSARTVEESLHRDRSGRGALDGARWQRGVAFAHVNIREYERVLGDNPSVRSGPPLSIGWRYSPEPLTISIEDYEFAKGPPRSSAEFCVPKTVRESMLKEHAEVSRPQMVAAVRSIQKDKAQRRKTVVNLGMAGVEEKIEGAKRKVNKILRRSSSYSNLEAKLWDDAQARAVEMARTLEESIKKGKGVSTRDLWSVGTPQDSLLPSRRNTLPAPQASVSSSPSSSSSPQPVAGGTDALPPTTTAARGGHKMSDRRNVLDESKSKLKSMDHSQKTNSDLGVEGTTPTQRRSSKIVAIESSDSESEEEILTRLRIDDSGAI